MSMPSNVIKSKDRKEQEAWHLIRMGVFAVFLLTAIIMASLRFNSIKIRGNTHYTEDEIRSMIFTDTWSMNPVYTFIQERSGEHPSLPFIESYVLNFTGIQSLEIIVYEKNVVGYIDYMSSHMYFDKDGIVVESSGSVLDGIPAVEGLEYGRVVLYEPLPVKDNRVFNDIMNLTGSLSSYEVACDRINYDEFLNATLWIGELRVKLGSNKDMEMKISTLHDILPELREQKGELDLSTYKEQNGNEAYIFKNT